MPAAGQGTELQVAKLEGFYKTIFGPKIERAIPEEAILTRDFQFKEAATDGLEFQIPVHLSLPVGVSWSPPAIGAFGFNPAGPGGTKTSKVQGSQLFLREMVAYDTAAKAQRDEGSYGRILGEVMLQMRESVGRILELELWYGQRPLATVASVSGAVVTVTDADWASGIFAGLEQPSTSGMPVMVLQALGSNGLPASADPRGTGSLRQKYLQAIDYENKKLTLSNGDGVAAGDIIVMGRTNDDAAGGALTYSGQWAVKSNNGATTNTWNSMIGLDKICSYQPTAAGTTLFNIDGFSYSLWKANQYAVGGPMNMLAIMKGMARSMQRGASGKSKLVVSPVTFAEMANDQASLRRFNATQSELANGGSGLKFHCVNGEVEIQASTFCKEGMAIAYQPSKYSRQGTCDITFDLGKIGLPGGKIFHQMQDYAGVQFGCYGYQCLYTSKPGSTVKFTGITNLA